MQARRLASAFGVGPKLMPQPQGSGANPCCLRNFRMAAVERSGERKAGTKRTGSPCPCAALSGKGGGAARHLPKAFNSRSQVIADTGAPACGQSTNSREAVESTHLTPFKVAALLIGKRLDGAIWSAMHNLRRCYARFATQSSLATLLLGRLFTIPRYLSDFPHRPCKLLPGELF